MIDRLREKQGIQKNFLLWEQKLSLYLTTFEAVKNALWLDNRQKNVKNAGYCYTQIWKYCYVWCLIHHLEILTTMKSNRKDITTEARNVPLHPFSLPPSPPCTAPTHPNSPQSLHEEGNNNETVIQEKPFL